MIAKFVHVAILLDAVDNLKDKLSTAADKLPDMVEKLDTAADQLPDTVENFNTAADKLCNSSGLEQNRAYKTITKY